MIALTRKKVIGIAIVVAIAIALAVTLPLVMSTGGLGQTTPMGIKGHMVLIVHDADGNVKQMVEKDNIIVTTGYTSIGYLVGDLAGISGYSAAAFGVIGIGTDNTPPAVGQVDLTHQNGGAANTGQCRETGLFKGLTWDSWQITYGWDPGDLTSPSVTGSSEFTSYLPGGIAIVEAGVFNTYHTDLVGVMLCRQTFGVVTIQATDYLTVYWTFDLTP